MKINSNKKNVEKYIHLNELLERYPQLSVVKDDITSAAECLINCFQKGGKLLVCGNGGSCSDSDHIVGELMKGFEQKRQIAETLKNELIKVDKVRGKYLSEKLQQGLPAISLTSNSTLITAVANDTDPDLIFAQQVTGYGKSGDVLIAISTSGNSQNILDAIITAKAKGMVIIGFTGEKGVKMRSYCDILINVPGTRTAFIQELHLPVFHALCLTVENAFFGNPY
jgi:D-sedoheptulose 7-phosphate isomerase